MYDVPILSVMLASEVEKKVVEQGINGRNYRTKFLRVDETLYFFFFNHKRRIT